MSIAGILRKWGKNSTHKVNSLYYNYISKQSALRALAQIESENGKLSAELRQKVNQYAVEQLGWKGYAPWLSVYTAISGSFREGWIPDNYYHLKVIPKIQGDYGKISFLKPLNRKIFKTLISPDIAFFINGHWLDRDFLPIGKEAVENISFTDNDQVVYKSDTSYQGRGVFVRNKGSFNLAELQSRGNGTLQKYIGQHPFLTSLVSGSVSNIRLTTVIDREGRPDLRACYLRIGRTGDTHVKSDSHVRVPIDLVSGELYDDGYLTDWTTVRRHPDSKVVFSKKKIPGYQECVRAVLELHQNFPMVRAIGWDLTVDGDNRPVLMEWNGYGNDIKFSEATQGPCFKDLEWHRL